VALRSIWVTKKLSVSLLRFSCAASLDIKWFADFRDPWTAVVTTKRLRYRVWRKKHRN
jgi:hypothetical protein